MGILSDILQQATVKFLWIGSIMGVLVGAGLLLKPQQMVRLNQYLSRWMGSERLVMVLDRPRPIERFIYRHHQYVGASMLIGALIVLYVFLFKYNLRRISDSIPSNYWWLSDAIISVLLIGSVFAALIGVIVSARPSLLRDFEKSLNRWISTEHMSSSLNTIHWSVEQSLIQHNRLSGGLILTGSFYVQAVLGNFLFRS